MIHTSYRNRCLALLLVFLGMISTDAVSQTSKSATDEANALYQAQKWIEAVKAYEAIAKTEPDNGRAWYRLGVSLHHTGKYEQATVAYRQAIEKMQAQGKPFAMYSLAASYAKLNDKEKALAWLDKVLGTGGIGGPGLARQLKDDADFASLRDEAHFKELLVAADKLVKPCMYSPKSRELDFWVGEWDVTISGQTVGTNSVQRLEDGCVIMENWASVPAAQTGKSINFYNPTTGKWRQTYVGNDLGIWEMSGEYRDGAMRYEGKIYSPRGEVMTRMTFFNLGPDKVRQLGENSTDGGKTWATVWDAMYVRKK
jgi:hypothetical protein